MSTTLERRQPGDSDETLLCKNIPTDFPRLVFAADGSGMIKFANDAYRFIFGSADGSLTLMNKIDRACIDKADRNNPGSNFCFELEQKYSTSEELLSIRWQYCIARGKNGEIEEITGIGQVIPAPESLLNSKPTESNPVTTDRVVTDNLISAGDGDARDSSGSFGILFSGHAATMLIVDPLTGNILDANVAAENFYGYSRAKIRSMNINDINALPPNEIHDEMEKAANSRSNCFIFPHRLANGSIRTVEVFSSPIEFAGRRVLFSIIHDITERKEAEDLLQQTRQNYETFFNSIDEFLFVLDCRGNIIHTNNVVNLRLGYSRDELVGRSVLILHPSERRDEASRIIREMLEGNAEFCPVPIVTKAGMQIPVETNVTVGVWNGQPVLFGVTKDISKIRLSEEKFSKVFYLNPSACAISNVESGEYIEINEAFTRLFGYTAAEAVGSTAAKLGIIPREVRAEILANADSNGNLTNIETDLKARDGSKKRVLMSSETIYVQHRKVRYTVVNDITERKLMEEALRASEEKFRSIAFVAPDPILVFDEMGKIVLVNPAAVNTFGYNNAEEMTGKSLPDFLTADDSLYATEFMLTVYESGTVRNTEFLLVRKDKTTFSAEVNSSALYQSDGRLRGILAAVRDVTDRKRAEAELQQSNQKLEAIISASPDGFGVVSLDGKIQLVSNRLAEMHGYSIEEKSQMLGKSPLDFIDVSNHHELIGHFRSILNDSDDIKLREYLAIRKDSSLFLIDLKTAVIHDADGNPVNILFIERDITDRKRAENTLKWNERLLTLMSDASRLGFYIVDHRNGRVLFLNERFCDIWEIPLLTTQMRQGELYDAEVTRLCAKLLVQPDIFTTIEKTTQDEANRTVVEIEITVKDDRVIRMYSTQIRGENDAYYGRLYIFEDITTEKEADEQLKKALAREMELNELKSRFVSMVSHEFRTPLTSIFSSAELLEYYGFKWDEEKVKFHLGKIQRSVSNLQALLTDVLYLNRAELHKIPFNPEPGNIKEFCESILDEFKLLKPGTRTFNFQFNLKNETQVFDSVIMRQILSNLIGNAVKYSPSDSVIDIYFNDQTDGYKMTVSNKGIGIPEEDREHIFDAFFRAKNSRNIEGTGLGLTIVKNGVTAHNGTINLDGSDNDRATFNVFIPYIPTNMQHNHEKENFNH